MKILVHTIGIVLILALGAFTGIWIGVCPYVPDYIAQPAGWLFFAGVVWRVARWCFCLPPGATEQEQQRPEVIINGRLRRW